MTEDEAKNKWCPFVRYVAPTEYHNDFEWNRDASHCQEGKYQRAFCIASQCMAWRWIPLQADEAFKNAVIKAKEDIGDKSDAGVKAAKHVIANRAAYGLPTEPFDGYCGLAGKP